AGPSSRSVTRCAPMCAGVGTKSQVSAMPGTVWSSRRQVQRASPPTAGAAKRWRSPTRSRTLRARGLTPASNAAAAFARPGNPCNGGETCETVTGTCLPGLPVDGIACNDGDACTVADTCQGGICAGTPVVCNPSDQCHAAGTCNPATGTCSDPPQLDGTRCDD